MAGPLFPIVLLELCEMRIDVANPTTRRFYTLFLTTWLQIEVYFVRYASH